MAKEKEIKKCEKCRVELEYQGEQWVDTGGRQYCKGSGYWIDEYRCPKCGEWTELQQFGWS